MKRKTINRILAVLVVATIFFGACTKEKSDVRLAPTLATTQVLNIKSDSATVVGFVVAEGDGYTEKGVCYNTAAAPTIANFKVVYTGQTTSAAFKVKVGGLKYATKYYARAYATNAAGTIYGEEYSFTTLSVVPFLSTTVVSEIKGTTATSGGNITDNGGEAVTARGVCWSIVHNPTIADGKTSDDKGNGLYTSKLTSLLGKTVYYARAYATNSIGTGYGPEVSFTTLIAVPTVTTTAITNITASGASSGGNVTIDGGDVILERGVCWSTTVDPTVADQKTMNGTGKGIFTSSLTGLSVATMYHVRAYAKNSAGVGYGPDVTFMTFPNAIYALGDGTAAGWDNSAAVKLEQSSTPGIYIANLDLTAAKSMKFILALGQWQPQWGQVAGASAGTLGVNLGSGSDPDAITTPAAAGKYKVTVDLGKMTYKVESSFPAALFMIGDGVGGWNWADVNLPMVPVNSHPNLFWKIVWLESTGSFKFAPQREWKDDFGMTGSATAGVYNKGGDNISVPGTAGYYMVVVDLTANKIAIADPKIYLMGNTIGSWDTGNAVGLFTVDNANSVVKITKTLAADELRMYAWHPWFTDWWQSEFMILGGKIEFRGTGGDQSRVAVTAGAHTVNLNFKTGNGAVL
ncbi:MAG: SusF/SusE family outer membrane protein [Mariniphaga sp.]|nr:SusF/SusE family outer membrane protein [Mariniphaga sp.]